MYLELSSLVFVPQVRNKYLESLFSGIPQFVDKLFPHTAQGSPGRLANRSLAIFGAPCGFSGRFEDGSFSMKTKMKICSNLH